MRAALLGLAGLAAAVAAVVVVPRYVVARAAGGTELATVATVAVAENGIGASERAHQLVAEVLWRLARRARTTPSAIVAGRGSPLAPWPTAIRYKALMATARAQMAANPDAAERAYRAAREGRDSQLVPGAFNWTHGGAPLERWVKDGYRVVASEGVPSKTRPYLWVYTPPA